LVDIIAANTGLSEADVRDEQQRRAALRASAAAATAAAAALADPV
jgi:hypothetical protein